MNERAGLLSVREISRRTGLPESTLRYYRKLFGECIPTVGRGRARRHPEAAVVVFQRISRLFAAGESRGAILRELGASGARPGPGAADYVSEGPPAVDLTPRYELAVAEPEGGLRSRELEKLLTAMMVRDRELVTMHRDLLELLEKLIHTLGSLAAAWAGLGARGASDTELAIPPGEAAVERLAVESLELERLRESLARERETVERLRRARLELEQRLARLEREEGERRRRR
jgi:DNA-binding transcriptional MerR regulator